MRAAIITKVDSYDPSGAFVNLFVMGEDQSEGMKNYETGVKYSANGDVAHTFMWLDEKQMSGPRCEVIQIAHEVSHGRERVTKDAKGVWDQLRNLIVFPREMIIGLHDHLEPEYKADEFIDWHVARLVLPENYVTVLQPRPMADAITGRELPGERGQYLNDLMEDWQNEEWGTPFPSSVRRRWARGDIRQRGFEQERERQERQQAITDQREPRRGLELQDGTDGGERRTTDRRQLEHAGSSS